MALPPFNYATLKEGVNNAILVRGVTLKFKMEIGYDFLGKNEILRITPLHFDAAKLHFPFSIGYFFANQSHDVTGVDMSFATENISLCGYGHSKYDGDVASVFAKMGELKKVVLTPIKHVFITHDNVCREKPYNDIMVGRMYKRMKEECTKTCKRRSYWICNSDLEKLLPNCHENDWKENEEDQCFKDIYENETKLNNIIRKPCTKLQYQTQESTIACPSNISEFELGFIEPAEVLVKEEYIIFDGVAMISAIGGTLGLCIGFSFLEIASNILRILENVSQSVSRRAIEYSSKSLETDYSPTKVKVKPCSGEIGTISRLEKMEMRISVLEDKLASKN